MLNAPQLETTKLSVSQQGWLEYKNQQGYTPVLKAAVPVAHKQKNKQPVYVGFYPVLLPTLRGFFFLRFSFYVHFMSGHNAKRNSHCNFRL